MIYWCPTCHRQDLAGVTHCVECGELLLALESVPRKRSKASSPEPAIIDATCLDCERCGASNRADAIACRFCDAVFETPLESAPLLAANAEESAPAFLEYEESAFEELEDSMSRAAQFFYAVLVIILLGLSAYYFMTTNEDSRYTMRSIYQRYNGQGNNSMPGPGNGTTPGQQ